MSQSDLLNGWFVDSSPGGGGKAADKCGNLKSSTGLQGSSTLTTTYNVDIGDRATVTPGTHPTINTGASPKGSTPTAAGRQRGIQIGFSGNGTVLFDGYAAMWGLPIFAQNSNKVSISFWISPDGDAQGSILASPFSSYRRNPSQDASVIPFPFFTNSAYDENFLAIGPIAGAVTPPNYTSWNGGGNYPAQSFGPVTAANANGTGGFDTLWGWACNGGAVDPWPGFGFHAPYIPDQGLDAGTDGLFYHVMISLGYNGSQAIMTAAINDTVLLNNAVLTNWNQGVMATNEQFLFQYGSTESSNADTYPAMRDHPPDDLLPATVDPYSNVWTIGGRMVDWAAESQQGALVSPFPEGEGLLGAVTEVWINEGVYVDWSNSANRNKFHTTDILGNVYVPTNIGAHGETPTGSRPTMYFTGIPDKFVINRANGATMNVVKGTRNSLTLDGRYPGAL